MSNYPIWWETTLTIYNKYEDTNTQKITWYKKVVNNCFWKYSGDKLTIGETVIDTNSIICRIPEDPSFLEKYQWLDADKNQYFTLGLGDIIVRGEVSDSVNEYERGSRSSDLIKKYKDLQGCMEIKEVSINTGRGRNNPHYFVRGI